MAETSEKTESDFKIKTSKFHFRLELKLRGIELGGFGNLGLQ